jgi:hypothetical protein
LLLLLFFIQTENTILGRAYTHLLGFNSAGADKSSMDANCLTVAMESLFLGTILIPILISLVSKPAAHQRTSLYATIRVGLSSWLLGATLSTMAHYTNALVVLNYAAGIGSSAAVFHALRRVRLTSARHYEWAFVAIAIPGLLLGIYSILAFYQQWGFPSLQTLLQAKYDTNRAAFNSTVLGDLDYRSTNTLYGLLACPCLAIVFMRVFSIATRRLAWAFLICTTINLVLSMSRTSLATFALAWLLVALFVRNRKAIVLSGLVATVLMFSVSGIAAATLGGYFRTGITYDVSTDGSAAARVESIQVSWQEFVDHPLIGLGASQSSTVVTQWVAHQLSVAQAAEHGVFGFLGVLVITGACVARLLRLLRIGGANDRLRLEFVFFLGPVLYFVRGLYSEVTTYVTVVNTCICLTFAMLAIAGQTTAGPAAEGRLRDYARSAVRTRVTAA